MRTGVHLGARDRYAGDGQVGRGMESAAAAVTILPALSDGTGKVVWIFWSFYREEGPCSLSALQ